MPASPDAAPRPKIDFLRRPPTPGEGSNGLALRRISAKLRSRIDEMRVDVARTGARTVLKKFAKDGNTETAHSSESSEPAIAGEANPDTDIITENIPRPKEVAATSSLAGDFTDEPGSTVTQEVGPGGWSWEAWGSTTLKGMCSHIRRYPSSHAPNITHLIADAAGQPDLDYATDNFESVWRPFFSQETLVELARKRFASPVISTINVTPAEYQGLAKTEEQRKLFAQWFGSAREDVGESMNRVSNIELRLFSDGQEIHILWEDGPDGKKGKVARVHRHSPTAKDRQQVELKLAQMKGLVPKTELFFGDESVLSLSELVDGEQITDPEDASRFAQMLDNRGFDGSSWDLNLGNIIKTKDDSLVFVDGDYIERLFLDQINAKSSTPELASADRVSVIGDEAELPVDPYRSHEKIASARTFFESMGMPIGKDGLISQDLSTEQIDRLAQWRKETMDGSIDMPDEDTFYRKTLLAASLWRQRNNGSTNYLLGKGVGLEVSVRGQVKGRTKRPEYFSCRSHSDFELYDVDAQGASPYPEDFKTVLGAQEFYPPSKTKGLHDLPEGFLSETAEVVDLGGVEVLVPQLELQFLDKWENPGAHSRPEGTDAEVLARQYNLNKDRIHDYLDRFVIQPEVATIQSRPRFDPQWHFDRLARQVTFTREQLVEDGIPNPTTDQILARLNRSMQQQIKIHGQGDTMIGGVRIKLWRDLAPEQIGEGDRVVDPVFIREIEEQMQREQQGAITSLGRKHAQIDELFRRIG